jgi:hypothetical protein
LSRGACGRPWPTTTTSRAVGEQFKGIGACASGRVNSREGGEYADFDVEAFEAWHGECARSRDIVAAAESL